MIIACKILARRKITTWKTSRTRGGKNSLSELPPKEITTKHPKMQSAWQTQKPRAELLRGEDVFGVGLDLDGGKAGGVPAAAQGFDQKDASDELLALEDGEFLFVAEEILLGADDIEIADQAAGVAAGGDIESAARSVDGLLLGLKGLIEHGEAAEIVLNFLKGAENGSAVCGDPGVVIGWGELQLRTTGAAGEDALREVGTERPEGALHVDELGHVRGLPASVSEKIE